MKLNESLVIMVVLGAFTVQAAVSVPAQSKGGSGGSSEAAALVDRILMSIKETIDRLFSPGRAGVGDSINGFSSNESANFRVFMQTYNKTYPPEELPQRMALFLERRQMIEESAKLFEQGRALFKMAENRFIDWTRQEIRSLKGFSMPFDLLHEATANDNDHETRDNNGQVEVIAVPVVSARGKETDYSGSDDYNDDDDMDGNMTVKYSYIPVAADWRLSGCISPPDDQGKCGSCYAIAVTHAIEAKRCIDKGESPHLSIQQILDCASRWKMTPEYTVAGCNGGFPTHVLNYYQKYNVVARDSCYRYQHHREIYCRMSDLELIPGCTLLASPSDAPRLQFKVLHNEQDVLLAILAVGPVITTIQATDTFLYYSQGIYDDPRCTRKQKDANHIVLIVGYGEQGGIPYWIVKNSYGPWGWGEQGYARVRRGVNACAIGMLSWSITS